MRYFKFLFFLLVFVVSFSNASELKVKDLYLKKCANCHGVNGEKKALGVSDKIAGWDSKKTLKALIDYKNGIRNAHNGNYGGLMKGQVKSLSEEDLRALAEYISKLKK